MRQSDLAIGKDGSMLVLVTSDATHDFTLTCCTAKGEPSEVMRLINLPHDFTHGFRPSNLWWDNGAIGLVDRENGKVAVIDESGAFLRWEFRPTDGEAVIEGDGFHGPRQYLRFISLLIQEFVKAVAKITKTSSRRNGNDPAKTPFSRNGLTILQSGAAK